MATEIHFFNRHRSKYGFLSNFHLCKICAWGYEWPSLEHAYQAAKTHDADKKARIREAETPGKAKSLGRQVKVREDWEDVKCDVMLGLLREKFKQNPDLKDKLLMTGPAKLVEDSTHDPFWGIGENRQGKNMLGHLLMVVRSELIEEEVNG